MHLSRHPTSYPTRYQEIAARLEQELRHHYRCGDYLPAEQQLATRFDVNRHTLRRAIDQLVERGWVQRRQGVGVLVLMRPIDYPLNAQARFSQNLLEQGSHPTSEKLLSVLRPASATSPKPLASMRARTSFTCAPCAGSTASPCA
jgi:GntR family phosphonate transport system transcriptional regulator